MGNKKKPLVSFTIIRPCISRTVAIAAATASLFMSNLGTAAEIEASTHLQRGEIIKRADVVIVEDANNSADRDLTRVVGQQVMRSIRAGQKITPNLIGPPILVNRNGRVSMIYRHGPLQIKAFGRALEPGGAGDVITVMNLDSRKKVSGVVNKTGDVEVNP